tara:strand:+ start:2789 stop:3241 length:453 start_codon:yes stop_codon:yes gene_type:complete
MEIEFLENGRWHGELKVRVGDASFNITTNAGGCGAMIMSNWAQTCDDVSLEEEEIEEIEEDLNEFLEIITKHKGNIEFFPGGEEIQEDEYISSLDIGSITALVGQNYFNSTFVKILENVGFKSLVEYPNPRHGMNYTQKLYCWALPINKS